MISRHGRILPRPNKTLDTKEPALKRPLQYKKASDDITTYADWGRKGDEKGEWHNIHGWNFQGDTETANRYKQEVEKLAKDYGVTPRALSANQIQTLTHDPEYFKGSVAGGSHAMLGFGDEPYSAHLRMPGPDEHLPHEFAHHASMNFAAVDAEGGLRRADRDNVNPQGAGNYITGFGTTDAEGKYLSMANKFIDRYGNLDDKSFKQALYKNVYDRETNKQRPELKHELATTVSYILSDIKLITHANNNAWLSKDYQYDPEEIWARGFQEFSRMKRLPVKDRYSGKNIITPETYNKIQKLMDTVKVIKGNVMTKGKTRDTGTRSV
jgi:hypothetical protein